MSSQFYWLTGKFHTRNYEKSAGTILDICKVRLEGNREMESGVKIMTWKWLKFKVFLCGKVNIHMANWWWYDYKVWKSDFNSGMHANYMDEVVLQKDWKSYGEGKNGACIILYMYCIVINAYSCIV